MNSDARTPVTIAPGARSAEDHLFRALQGLLEEARSSPEKLRHPVRVLVPADSLRIHLCAELPRRLGRSLLGVRVQTLWGAAFEVLAAAGEEVRLGELRFELFARRRAADESALNEALGSLEDGTVVAMASMSDLSSAGLTSEIEAATLECIARLPRTDAGERALALIRATSQAAENLRAAGSARLGDVYARAGDLLDARGAGLLPSRALFVHGFADVTGRAGDLLEALTRHLGAEVILEEPPDPSFPRRRDRGAVFVQRLAARVGVGGRPVSGVKPPAMEFFQAASPADELREVALRIREHLDRGVRPERILVVARRIDERATLLRQAFEDLGIPFSGGQENRGLSPTDRTLSAWSECLRAGPLAEMDAWLDVFGPRNAPLREDLHLALRSLGIARVRDLAALEPAPFLGEHDSLALPAGGMPDDEDSAQRALPSRRRLSGKDLRGAVRRARELLEDQEAAAGSLGSGLASLRRIARRSGLRRGPTVEQLEGAFAAIEDEVGASTPIEHSELLFLLERALERSGERPLGGLGAGVQVSDADEARGRTADHLFLIGLNRGVFPRVVREDPLLSDALRAALGSVLPHLPLKAAGHDEERHLFASLVSSSDHVTLSWLRSDASGRALAISPLLHALIRQRSPEEIQAVPRMREELLREPWCGTPSRPRSARESLRLAALAGARPQVAELFGLALEEASTRLRFQVAPNDSSPSELAAARVQILEELDPDLRTRAGRQLRESAGPWSGLVGGTDRPASETIYVTALQAIARCPWQAFLQRRLRIEPTPDPISDLPELDALLLGQTVHLALERLVRASLPPASETNSVEDMLGAEGVEVPRPGPERVLAETGRAAREVLLESGFHLPGLARALCERAKPFVDRALDLDWPTNGAPPRVLAVEVEGVCRIPEDVARGLAGVELAFKADRVQRAADGIVLVDYKTGKPPSDGKREETRDRHLLAKVAEGSYLQGAAYAASGANTRGAYLFLDPDLDEVFARLDVGRSATESRLHEAARVLDAAWRRGPLPPRLEDDLGKANRACESCSVALGCIRGDTGARRRLRGWIRRSTERPVADLAPAERRLAALWRLGAPGQQAGNGEEGE